MATLLVFEFPSDGPFGDDAVPAYKEVAEDIAQQKGLIWKTWIEDSNRKVSGGAYLFEDADSAKEYTEMHTERLAKLGFTDISAASYQVNEGLSEITHAKLSR